MTLPNGSNDDEIAEAKQTASLVECLMGRKPELRFAYIQEHAQFVANVDI
ncbi:MAG: hypothetical protein ACKVIF_03260 [Rhodospirillales bacterium]